MKKHIYFPIALIAISLISSCSQGQKITRVDDTRELNDFEFTINNLTTTDSLGRTLSLGDKRRDDKLVGMFYHVWHGYHNSLCDDLESTYNISYLLENDPDTLWNPSIHQKDFHYWGEPLYGYYNSSDPWVIARHMELLMNAGVDYLVYDLTNSVIYVSAINTIFSVLEEFQNQGFKVPKVAFYTNSNSGQTISKCYDYWYKEDKYKSLWFSLNGEKPLIIGKKGEVMQLPNGNEIIDKLDIVSGVWPTDPFQDPECFPWMSWNYPQDNFYGTMSVSLAQHPGMRMSEGSGSNRGRGFNYPTYSADPENFRSGTNFEGQWKTVFDTMDKTREDYDEEMEVNNVFITGFNEWIAQKLVDGNGQVYFVDTFNEEYSRDVEMCKNGYGDNFYCQLMENVRKFAFTEGEHYKYIKNTIDINDSSLDGWSNVKNSYLDLANDARERDFSSADQHSKYVDKSNRNDITKTTITHDNTNLYVKVETKENLTVRDANDKNYMNIYINSKKNEDSFNGFDFVINRSCLNNKASIERLRSDFKTEKVGECDIVIKDNVLQVAIPLKTLGLNGNNCNLSLKVTDNLKDEKDILDYYVSGDVAPLGRLGYEYGY